MSIAGETTEEVVVEVIDVPEVVVQDSESVVKEEIDDLTLLPCTKSTIASTSTDSFTSNNNITEDAVILNKPKRSLSSHSNRSSASSSRSNNGDICRICHCEGTTETPLITPCYCSGSLKFVHQKCLQQWIKSSQTRSCEVCRFSFNMQTKLKPFRKWEKLDMSSVERRKILCSVTFHIIAITCVVWSLYVLIERTSEEIRSSKGDGNLSWPFWTKLVVVAIGFTGGLVFMYVQCKMYIQLFTRWKAYNKVIYVQNCPEGLLMMKRGNPTTVIQMKSPNDRSPSN